MRTKVLSLVLAGCALLAVASSCGETDDGGDAKDDGTTAGGTTGVAPAGGGTTTGGTGSGGTTGGTTTGGTTTGEAAALLPAKLELELDGDSGATVPYGRMYVMKVWGRAADGAPLVNTERYKVLLSSSNPAIKLRATLDSADELSGVWVEKTMGGAQFYVEGVSLGAATLKAEYDGATATKDLTVALAPVGKFSFAFSVTNSTQCTSLWITAMDGAGRDTYLDLATAKTVSLGVTAGSAAFYSDMNCTSQTTAVQFQAGSKLSDGLYFQAATDATVTATYGAYTETVTYDTP